MLTFYFYPAQRTWYDPERDGEQDNRLQIQVKKEDGLFADVDGAVFYSSHDNAGWVKCDVPLSQSKSASVIQ